MEQIEADFWAIIEGGEQAVQVLYGADLDTRGGRSGFPVKRTQRAKSCVHPVGAAAPHSSSHDQQAARSSSCAATGCLAGRPGKPAPEAHAHGWPARCGGRTAG